MKGREKKDPWRDSRSCERLRELCRFVRELVKAFAPDAAHIDELDPDRAKSAYEFLLFCKRYPLPGPLVELAELAAENEGSDAFFGFDEEPHATD